MRNHYGEGVYNLVDKDGKEYLLTVENDTYSYDPRAKFDNVTTMVCWHSRHSLGDNHDYDGIEDFFQDLCKKVLGKDYEETEDLFWRNMFKMLEESNLIYIKPLNLYEHSGMTISTSNAYPYNDRWDSSPVGFAYVTKQTVFKECGGIPVRDENGEYMMVEHKHEGHPSTYSVKTIPLTDENWKERAEMAVDDEVETYDYYLRGEVYGYTLEEKVHYKDETRCPHCNEIIKVDEYDDWEEVDSCWGFYGSCLEENGILDSISSDLKFKEE